MNNASYLQSPSLASFSSARRNKYIRRYWLVALLIIGGAFLLTFHIMTCPCSHNEAQIPRRQVRTQAIHKHLLSGLWQVNDEDDNDDAESETENNNEAIKAPEKQSDEQILSANIRLIINAVLKAGNQEMTSFSKKPNCRGDRLEQEVEDILCIPRPKFLENVKNPCWRDTTSSLIRCLPKFHILGCEKCGSSDLWQRITAHPHTVKIQGTKQKEANWWGWQRYGIYGNRSVPIRNFTRYTESFKQIAQRVQNSLETNGEEHRLLITQDGTPSDFWDFRGWQNVSQNRGLRTPKILTPHLMTHFYPDPKLIVIFRNPVDRLYSDYFFTSHGKNATGFHKAVLKAIHLIATCLKVDSVRNCFFSPKVYASLPVRFHYMFYSVYLREWLQVFPRDKFLFFKTEEYERDPMKTLRISFKFIGLQPLNSTNMNSIAGLDRFRVGVKRQEAGDMLPATRVILETIAGPCNRQFAQLMGDNKYEWD